MKIPLKVSAVSADIHSTDTDKGNKMFGLKTDNRVGLDKLIVMATDYNIGDVKFYATINHQIRTAERDNDIDRELHLRDIKRLRDTISPTTDN